MSNLGDQTPPKGPDKNPPDLNTNQTLPEGAFDKTLSDDRIESLPATAGDASTVVVDQSACADESMTMIGDEPIGADENATMVGFGADEAGQASGSLDPDKTLPDGVLAVLADEDYSMKTIMMDDVAISEESASLEEDFGKTLPDGAFDQMAGENFGDKTMMLGSSEGGAEFDDGTKTLPEGTFVAPDPASATRLEDGSQAAENDDNFGKTVQADAFGKTIATDTTIASEPEFDGKTMVGPDSTIDGEFHVNIPTVADAKLKRPGVPVARSRATHTGGKTSIVGTDVVGTEMVEGIDKDSLNVAMRSISGLQYGAVPRVDFKLVKQLGEGGMGVVYVARQQSLGREVVFKTLKPMAKAQASKLKASGTIDSVIKQRRDMFLSEAVVTANLFHPNIVPIYELAKAPDGALFYTMKWVRGDGWHKRLKEMTLAENLEVLMKVSDAMAFAHSRNIINRDLKPENVMLGGYGETIVLDWGLALPFGEGKHRLPVATTAGLGSGTPAYMPPELITGPLATIGPPCDIYLLGAMLFEVVTGLPPHDFSSRASGGTVSAGAKLAEVRRVVVENIIRETEHTGELIDIAKKAMATNPEDRYRTVVDFQNAIRDYLKHAASHTLADRAKELTVAAAPVATESQPAAEDSSTSYTNYQNALTLYNESLREWSGNELARKGLTETQKDFAELALVKGDFDLGLAVLDTNAESHSETRSKLLLARQERESRVRRMKVLRWTAIGLLIGFAGVSALAAKGQFDLAATEKKRKDAETKSQMATVAMNAAEKAAEKAKDDEKKANERSVAAEKQRVAAVKLAADAANEKVAAEKEKEVAQKEKLTAEADTRKAKKDTELAVAAQKKAEELSLEADQKRIDADKKAAEAKLAEAKAKENQRQAAYKAELADASRTFYEGNYPDTIKKLTALKAKYDELCGAEWEQLMNAASAPEAVSLAKPVESIGLSRDGRKMVTGDSDGRVVVWPIDAAGKILSDKPIHTLELGAPLRAVAISPDGNDVAAAMEAGDIRVWSLTAIAKEPRVVLKGHSDAVNTLKFSADGKRLVSGSDDRTVRLWSVEKDLADEKRLLVASKTLLYAVRCVDLSRDGQWLVAGTSSPQGNLNGAAYSWEVGTDDEKQTTLIPVRQFQVVPKSSEKVKQNRGVVTIALTDDGKFAVSNGPAAELYLWQVDLPAKDRPKKNKNGEYEIPLKINQKYAVKLGDLAPQEETIPVEKSRLVVNHSNRLEKVRSVAFSVESARLYAAGDDGTISIWDRVMAGELPNYVRRKEVIYGHGGPVRGCLPLPQSPDLIISGSSDQNVHRLDLKTYFERRQRFEEFKKEQSQQPAAFRPADSDVSLLDTQHPADSATCGSDGPTEPNPSELVLVNFPQSEQDKDQKKVVIAKSAEPKSEPRESVRIAAGIDDNKDRVGHTDSVLSAVFSRDGTRVLSASRDQTARTWISDTGLPVNTVTGRPAIFDGNRFQEGHEYDLFVMRFFPDGRRLLTSGFDGEMRIWDSQLGESFGRELATLPFTSMYGVVDISRDGQWILTAGRGSTRRQDDAPLRQAEIEEQSYEAQAQLWNTDSVLENRRPRPAVMLKGVHRFRVTTVAISPDNSRLLTGDREGRLVLWDAKTGKPVGQPRVLHAGEVVKSQFFRDGKRLLTAGVDRRVVLWNVVKSESEFVLERIQQFDQEGMVDNLAVSPLEDRFISVIRLSDKQLKNKKSNEASTKVSLWLIKSPPEEVVINVWAGREKSRTQPERDRDRSPFVAWAANGTQAVITTSEGITFNRATTSEGIFHFYDSKQKKITESLRVDNSDGADYRAEPYAAILRPDEPEPKHLLSQTHTAAFLWKLQGGLNLVSFRPQGPVFSAGYSSDGRYVVTGGRSVRIFEANESKITYGRLLHKLEYPHDGVTTSVEFSPAKDSYRFLTTSFDETAKIWEWHPGREVVDPKPVHELRGHVGPVRFGTWSADGQRVLTVGEDAQPRVWDFPAGKNPQATVLKIPPNLLQLELGGKNRVLEQLGGAFSWDGNFVAVGGRDVETDESIGWIWHLNPTDGATPMLHATVRGHGLGGIKSVAFLPDDNRLLTGGADGTARLWDWQKSAVGTTDGKVLEADFLITLVRKPEDIPQDAKSINDKPSAEAKVQEKKKPQATTHRGPVTSVRVTREGNILTASADGTVLIWPK
jgi:WD40 repeat protein/serine/threonine protein kinase